MTPTPLPSINDLPCRWRKHRLGPGVYKCDSPKLVGRRRVDVKTCAGCYCRDHEPITTNPHTRTPSLGKRQSLPTLEDLPCVHRSEHPVSYCHGCGANNPARHTYGCNHPDAEHALCVPVPALDVEYPEIGVKACRRCNLREPGKGVQNVDTPSEPPESSLTGGSVVMAWKPLKWSYGVTTVPQRRQKLLPETLLSLDAAGFTAPHLFVDGEKDSRSWEQEFGLNVTCRYPNLRTYGNWILSLAELFIRNPTADRFAIFQDDFVTVKNLRSYLERTPYPERGYLNLYTFPQNQELAPKDRVGFYPSNQLGLGAVALVFNRDAVILLLSSKYMAERPLDARRGWKSVDGGVVSALKKVGYTEYVHNPSLVQHVGLVSSMRNRRHRQAVSFPGEHFDALTLLSQPTPTTR